jgi:O-antigen ligase
MEYVYYFVMMLLALLAGIGVVVAWAGFLHLSHRLGNRMIRASVVLIAVLTAISVVLSGRDLSHVGESITNLYGEDAASGGTITRFMTWAIVLMLLGVLLDRIIRQRLSPGTVRIQYGWMTLFCIFVLSNGIISSFLGTYPSFTPGLLYPLIFLLALAADPSWEPGDILRSIKTGLLVVFLLGFALAVVKPGLVFERGATDSLALLPFRYWGATPHANAMGSMAVLYLLLEILSPTRGKFWRWLGIGAALASIVLAQSKTALLGFALCLGCIWIAPTYRGSAEQDRNGELRTTLKLLLVILLPVLLLVLLSAAGYEHKLYRLFDSDAGKSVTTLTGRTKIWEAALLEWQTNPLFGYGPNLFSLEHRMRIGMLFAFHAHNQFIQSLAQSGLIGLFGLLLFLGALAYKLFKHTAVSRGVSLALLAFLLIRCITEVPLRSGNMISGEYLYLLAIVAIAMSSTDKLARLRSDASPTARIPS